jgi:hypothetical protein
MALSPLAQNNYAFIPLVHAERLTGELNSRDGQLCAECRFDIRIVGRKKRDVGRIVRRKRAFFAAACIVPRTPILLSMAS